MIAEAKLLQKQEELDGLNIIDIDAKHKDPQMCGLYAPDIYQHLRAMEVGMALKLLLLLLSFSIPIDTIRNM